MNETERYLFDLQGYLVIPQVLSASMLEEMNEILDELDALNVPHDDANLDGTEVVDYNLPFHQVVGHRIVHKGALLHFGAPFRALVGHPATLPYLSAVLGDNFRLDQGQAIIAGRDGIPDGDCYLHGSATPIEPGLEYRFHNGSIHCGLVVMSFALTDMPEGKGGFCCIPGSHKANFPTPLHLKNHRSLANCVRSVGMQAGDAVLFVENLTHGTTLWQHDYERRSAILRYCPGHMAWTPEVLRCPEQYDDWRPDQRRLFAPPFIDRRAQLLGSAIQLGRLS